MRDHEGAGRISKPKTRFLRSFFEVAREKGVFSSLFESFVDFFEDFDEVGTGAATGIENVHVRVREAVWKIQFLAEDSIDASDHVLNDFGRGIPDAELLTEFRIVGLEKRFVEILDGVGFLEFCENVARSTRLRTPEVQSRISARFRFSS